MSTPQPTTTEEVKANVIIPIKWALIALCINLAGTFTLGILGAYTIGQKIPLLKQQAWAEGYSKGLSAAPQSECSTGERK